MTPAVQALRSPLRSIAARLDLLLDEQTIDRLLAYLDLLLHWNAHYNLTAVREPVAMLHQHLADSLAVVSPLRRQLSSIALPSVLDVGSGNGLPGVVIASTNPLVHVTCLDSVGKKAAFVRQAMAELGLQNLQAVHARVESWSGSKAAFDVVACRAFASLHDFVELTSRLVAKNGVWMAMKGKLSTDESAKVGSEFDVFHVEHLDVPELKADRCLVWIRRRP